jgi:hypothetical protein
LGLLTTNDHSSSVKHNLTSNLELVESPQFSGINAGFIDSHPCRKVRDKDGAPLVFFAAAEKPGHLAGVEKSGSHPTLIRDAAGAQPHLLHKDVLGMFHDI